MHENETVAFWPQLRELKTSGEPLMALVPGQDAGDVPLDPVPVYENADLNGLADDWESDSRVRRPALKAGGVLQWPDPKKMGVVNFASIKLNCEVLTHLLHIWCPIAEDRKTVPIKLVKPQEFVGLLQFFGGLWVRKRMSIYFMSE